MTLLQVGIMVMGGQKALLGVDVLYSMTLGIPSARCLAPGPPRHINNSPSPLCCGLQLATVRYLLSSACRSNVTYLAHTCTWYIPIGLLRLTGGDQGTQNEIHNGILGTAPRWTSETRWTSQRGAFDNCDVALLPCFCRTHAQ